MSWTREEVAYAAGLFEGEGSFSVGFWDKRRRSDGVLCHYSRQTLGVTMTDFDVLERFGRCFDVEDRIRGPYLARAADGRELKPRYTLNVYRFERAQAMVAAMWPWLCERRRQQVRDGLKRLADYYAGGNA